MQALQSTDTVIGVGTAGQLANRERQWIVAPAQSTWLELDTEVVRSREPEATDPASSSTSMWLDSDFVERILRGFHQTFTEEMLTAIENSIAIFFVGSTDSSATVLDCYSAFFDASSVKNEVDRLFSLATFLDLEPGTTNEFSEGIEQVVERHGGVALNAIKNLVLNEQTESSIALEVLKYIGNEGSEKWHNERRLMLEECLLKCRSVWARDGAGLGLSFLGDPRSIYVLEQAIERETSLALAKDLRQVLYRLKKVSSDSKPPCR